jgi:uncharacterized membrane protein YeaQ/YmgE (transglycosylase-associated protein family)
MRENYPLVAPKNLSSAATSGIPVAIERPGVGPWWRLFSSLLGGLLMGIIAWIVLGLIAGAIAKAIMPGNDPGGIIVTMLIGIVGAFLGGFIGATITGNGLNGFSLWSIVLAVVGALVLLWLYRVSTRGRTTSTTP